MDFPLNRSCPHSPAKAYGRLVADCTTSFILYGECPMNIQDLPQYRLQILVWRPVQPIVRRTRCRRPGVAVGDNPNPAVQRRNRRRCSERRRSRSSADIAGPAPSPPRTESRERDVVAIAEPSELGSTSARRARCSAASVVRAPGRFSRRSGARGEPPSPRRSWRAGRSRDEGWSRPASHHPGIRRDCG